MAREQARLPRARHGTDLVLEELPDELLVYDNTRHQAHCLNRTAALVWRLCDGKTDVEEMTAALAEAGLPRDPALVALALEQLAKAHLLEVAPRSDEDAGGQREDAILRSRRKALKQLGLIAGTAMALPLVQSIWAPVAAQSASQCGLAGQPCCPPRRSCDRPELRCRGNVCR